MPGNLLDRLLTLGHAVARGPRRRLLAATRPATAPLAVGTLADLARSKPALVAENALLRHQLSLLRRSVARPRCTPADRALFVVLASRVRTWRLALLIVHSDRDRFFPVAVATELYALLPDAELCILPQTSLSWPKSPSVPSSRFLR